jgi:phosphopantothenoylcysteine decarboxylase/phosphopantothenate--cysteine ligase
MSGALAGKQIVLGITGSIAAYKAAELIGLLRQHGSEVWPVMTAAAVKMITPLTIQTLARNPVALDLWEEGNGWQPGHIELADRADLLLIAPATADTIARLAMGLAPDLLSSLYLATEAPLLIAPAMNGKMFGHVATQTNISTLKDRGHYFIGPAEGMQACGYSGLGRMSEPEEIVLKVLDLLGPKS